MNLLTKAQAALVKYVKSAMYKSSDRPILNGLYVDKEAGYVGASNGYAFHAVELEGFPGEYPDTGVYVPVGLVGAGALFDMQKPLLDLMRDYPDVPGILPDDETVDVYMSVDLLRNALAGLSDTVVIRLFIRKDKEAGGKKVDAFAPVQVLGQIKGGSRTYAMIMPAHPGGSLNAFVPKRRQPKKDTEAK